MIGVIGGSGFFGSHVCRRLDEQQIRYAIASRRFGVDARRPVELSMWMEEKGIDSVINLAAECGGIGLNRDKPFDLWLATSKIIATVFEVCSKRLNMKKITTVGTVCSYAKDCPTPFKEEDLFHHGMPELTNSAYGVAKLSGLMASNAVRKQFGLNSIFLLPANMYGPRDHFDDSVSHVIPALIKKCKTAIDNNQAEMVCWGSGKPTREFLYVGDAADAVIQAHLYYDKPEPINVGTGVETSIEELVTTICSIMGYKGKIIWDTNQPDGQPKRRLDVSKAEKEFGFKASTPLKEGLKKTIDWYLDFIGSHPNVLKLLKHYENGVITEYELLNRFAEAPEQKMPKYWKEKVDNLIAYRNSMPSGSLRTFTIGSYISKGNQ